MKMTDGQLAYEHAKAVGWNEAVKASAEIARMYTCWIGSENFADSDTCQSIAVAIEKLDKSVLAIDD